MCHIYFIYSSVSEHLCSFHTFVIVNNAAVKCRYLFEILILIILDIYSEVALLDHVSGSSIFDSLRNIHTVCHKGYTISHSHWQCIRVSISSRPYQYLLLSFEVFFVIVIVTVNSHVKCWYTVVLICTSLIIRWVKYLFIYLVAKCLSSLEKCLLKFLAHFENQVTCFLRRFLILFYLG